MTKVFALIILSLLSTSQLQAAQFGAPPNQDQAMAGNDNGANPNDSNDDGSAGDANGPNPGGADSGGDNGADEMDNLQPPAGPQAMDQLSQDSQPDPNADMQNSPGAPDSPQMQASQDTDDQSMDANPNGTTEISTESQPTQPGEAPQNDASVPSDDPNHPEVKHQQKLKGIDYIHQLQNTLLEGNKQAMCGEGGICRKNFGEGCKSSKNFLSVCATICGDMGEFRGSHCINNGAKRYQMNPQTFVYNARPDKQKSAESVVQHIAVQLREGRNALRDDKRLFFNTFCTPPSIQMIPEIDRQVLARACLDFLYNGYPPAAALRQLAADENNQPPPIIPPSPTFQLGGDDVRGSAPLGGLICNKALGRDKGAEYKGKYPPIVEDKESASDEDCEEPVKKTKIKKKVHKKKVKAKKKSRLTKSHKATTAHPAKKNSKKAAPITPSTQPSKNAPTAAAANDDNSDDQDDQEAQPGQDDQNNQSAPVTNTPQQAQQNQAPPPQQQAQPQQKKDNLLAGLGGADGLKGLINKFTHKKGGGAQGGNAANEDQNGDDQSSNDGNGNANAGNNAGDKKNKLTGALGKFLKF
ncbi:hypothetical protein [Candidatus Odyssella acanthamoebae]|uniref:Uncharacterized protein n=1 Tax=Candidatus Odyssella acanthamoebae TaxID=91604 RepID=A0A077AW87_9PROT|nr:hypothetical protein [Candidatus Paracaedibacter acanthamoebae]AIK96666.1 hypothetical protein ID47_07945 [Candidatus Paracaedibacter acanthamoebae]